MPRSAISQNSALAQIQQQARRLLSSLGSKIRSSEGDLRRLKEDEAKLSAIANRGRTVTDNGAARTSASKPRRRTDWTDILKTLPNEFKANDIRKVRGLKEKRSSEIFAAISRWIESGLVKRRARGLYKRTQ